MFRALAHFDQDFSRHIEGNALRLHWDKASLLELVSGRLRIALNLEDVEASEKVWNAFVDDSLKGREKFEECLGLTLYRPRDILILLNRGYVIGRRRGARRLRAQDIEAAATEISNDRLDDLIKEYDSVLPGLRSFVRVFEGAPASMPIGTVDELLDEEIQSGAYQAEWDSDFALLGTGRHVADALYGVGFLGLEDRRRERVVFCHDGSGTEVEELEEKDRMVVHPCYWRALEVKVPDEAEQLTVEISDEFDSLKGSDLGDIRFRRLGQVISELPGIAVGTDGSGQFEQWVLRAVKILFAGKLANPELHPAPDAIQRRDVVATNEAERGIWKRVREDYGSRQVIFEVKNYEDLRMDDFRQVLSYTSGEYGRFAVICHRGDAEGVGSKERGWLQTMYHEHQRLILTIPDIILRRSISKLRNVDRHDYVEYQLGKRLDTFVRSYLSLKHVERYRPKKRRRKSGG